MTIIDVTCRRKRQNIEFRDSAIKHGTPRFISKSAKNRGIAESRKTGVLMCDHTESGKIQDAASQRYIKSPLLPDKISTTLQRLYAYVVGVHARDARG